MRLRDAFVRAASAIVLLSLPTAFGMAATAHLFTPIALGEKWLAAIPIIKVLSVYGGMIAVLSPITTTLLAVGRPATVALLNGMNLVAVVPCIYYATVRFGSIGAADAMTLVLLVFLPLYYGIAARAIGLGFRDVLGIFARPVVSTLSMYAVVDFFFGRLGIVGDEPGAGNRDRRRMLHCACDSLVGDCRQAAELRRSVSV